MPPPRASRFFTFKGISYVADAAKRPEDGTKSFFEALFYISFLPEVMSGPLSRFFRLPRAAFGAAALA